MPLVPLDALEPLFVCPRCGMRLLREREGFHCESSTCPYGSEGSFRLVDGAPVIIDFDRSIVRKMEVDDAAGSGSVPPLRARSSSFERLPGWLRRVWRPTNKVAARNVQQLIALLPSSSTVLVVGGGTIGNGVEALYVQPGLRIVAFDVYSSPNVQFLADAHQIPLAGSSIDAVVVQAVLEHVLDPERVVSEIERVLRPEGLVYAETPFLQQVHAGPYTSCGTRAVVTGFSSGRSRSSPPARSPGRGRSFSGVSSISRAASSAPGRPERSPGGCASGFATWTVRSPSDSRSTARRRSASSVDEQAGS